MALCGIRMDSSLDIGHQSSLIVAQLDGVLVNGLV